MIDPIFFSGSDIHYLQRNSSASDVSNRIKNWGTKAGDWNFVHICYAFHLPFIHTMGLKS